MRIRDHPLPVAIATILSLELFVQFGAYSNPHRPAKKTVGAGAGNTWKGGSALTSPASAPAKPRCGCFRDRDAQRAGGSECRLSPDTERHFWWKPHKLVYKGLEGMRRAINELLKESWDLWKEQRGNPET